MTVESNRYVSSIPPLSLPTRWKQLTSTFSLSRSRTAPVSNNHLFEGDLQHRLFPPCNLGNPSRLSSRRWTSLLWVSAFATLTRTKGKTGSRRTRRDPRVRSLTNSIRR